MGAKLVALSGLAMVVYGVAFLVRNFTGFIELGLTPELVGGTPESIHGFSASLYRYISHLHIAVAGLIIGLGFAVLSLAWFGIRARQRWAAWTALLAPALALAIVLPPHYAYGLATPGHLGPVYAALGVLVAGVAMALAGSK